MLIELNAKLHDLQGNKTDASVADMFVKALNLPVQGLKKDDITKRTNLAMEIAISESIDFDLDQLKLLTDIVPSLAAVGTYNCVMAELFNILDVKEKKEEK